MSLLEVPDRSIENNFVGRLTYGDIGLDLKRKNDPDADKYLRACTSIFKELDSDAKTSKLLSSLELSSNAKVEELKLSLNELKSLLVKVTRQNDKTKIPRAKAVIEHILSNV